MIASHGHRRYRVLNTFIFIMLAVTIAMTLFIIAMFVEPAGQITMGDRTPILTEEYTSSGVPVIRKGQPVIWSQDFCNDGTRDATVNRWIDVHGQYSVFDDIEEQPAISFAIGQVQIYGSTILEPGCQTDTNSAQIIPDDIHTGVLYQLRNDVVYDVNALKSATASTHFQPDQTFLYLDVDAPIP